MSEIVVRIKGESEISVEETIDGIKCIKRIDPDGLIKCISSSLMRSGVLSGLLPNGCLSFNQYDNGTKAITLLFPEKRADISYYGTVYSNFPLPKLVFGFNIISEARISCCRMGVIENSDIIKPDTKMFYYPFSNVNGFNICTGSNPMPKCTSLHTLGSLPYFILSMPNSNDYFKPINNKQGLEMRDLLELLKDKEPEYYYSDILVPFQGVTLNDFINQKASGVV